MGLMMWLMMRGRKQDDTRTDAELARLRAEIDQLRAEGRDRESPSAKSNRPL